MSASLVVLIPVLLLGLVTSLCFVGCVFQTGGIGEVDLGPYRNAITKSSNLIAFWPLDDAPPTDPSAPVARDNAAPFGQIGFDGTYKGNFTLRVDGIVTGDHPAVGSAGNPCASFDGGLVEVLFNQSLNPSSSFTLECWVQPKWTSAGTQQAVMVSATVDMGPTPMNNAGYALYATPTIPNFWAAQIGIGTDFVGVTSNQGIVLNGKTTYYLAMSFKDNALSLFVGVDGTLTPVPPMPMQLGPGQTFKSEQPGATATSLFIAMGRPDLPTTNEYPFNGLIQDVAFYSPALEPGDIQNHFTLGSKSP
jgi:Concanavalin A-like lectin/glucanases superfamily